MYAVDQTYLAEPSALTSRDGDWLRQGLIVAKRGIKSLHCDIEVRVLVLQDNAELLFVGTVIDRDDTSCSLRLWGGGELLIQLSSVRRVGVVGSHSQRERADVIRRQRAGQPARVYGECKPPPSVELSDEMYERVQEFAAARGLSVEQATAKLIDVAAGRLAALRKYAEKSSRLTCGAR